MVTADFFNQPFATFMLRDGGITRSHLTTLTTRINCLVELDVYDRRVSLMTQQRGGSFYMEADGPGMEKLFGKSVRDRRWQLGISQNELAERAELKLKEIVDIERGAPALSLASIIKVVKLLNLSSGNLFEIEPTRKRAARHHPIRPHRCGRGRDVRMRI